MKNERWRQRLILEVSLQEIPKFRRPIIGGTGVTVQRIVGWFQIGLSPEEILAELPHLTLAQVYAALTYYQANRDDIEADIIAEKSEAERLAELHGSKEKSA